jgi:enoyl-CoA hydratase/carnithine racemase
MSYKTEIQDNIAIFIIDNPPTNSINTEVLKGLEKIIDRVNTEQELKGLVLTGTGNIFSNGFDLGTFTTFEGPEQIIQWFTDDEEIMYKLFTCSKPVVGALNGHASAAGLIITQACDYRMMKNDPKAKVGMPEIKLGMSLSPSHGEIMKYGLETNKNWKEVIYKGERITAPVALEMGIIDELVDEAELLKKAKAKVCEYIDTPNRPFIAMKASQRRLAAKQTREAIDNADFTHLIATFTNPAVIKELKASLDKMNKPK